MLAGTAAGSPLEDVTDVPARVAASGLCSSVRGCCWHFRRAMVRFRCIHSVARRKTKIKLLSSLSWVKVTPPDYVVVYVHAFGTFEGPWSGSAASIASRGKKRTIKLLSSQCWVKVTIPDYVVVYVHAFGTFEGPWSGSAASIASRGKKRTIKLLSSQSWVEVTPPDYVVVYVDAFGTFEGPWSVGCLSRSNVRVPTDGGTSNPWKSDSAYHTYNIAGVRRIHGVPVGNNCSETGKDLAKLRSFIREPVLSNCRTFSGMSATNAHDTTFSDTSSKKLATTEQSRQPPQIC
ncbi:hypothetical protein T03_17065 [Trichinella britovi]|uniref:Uncharacterized protein n=1 Tax=Trichinella britovi TaxID=45882 RepID=A0A0V1CYG3_TRIBR|nr:hypothetical protein T03_17065 [Trichinella britovi]